MSTDSPHPGPVPEGEGDTKYRVPAEGEPHAATWLSFPHNESSWSGKLPAAQHAYAQMVAALADSEPVHINVNDAAMEAHARRLFEEVGARGEIHFHHFPTNDAWCRDHGAMFVQQSSRHTPCAAAEARDKSNPADGTRSVPATLALNFHYNAWGEKYPPFDLDNAIPPQMAKALNIPCIDVDMVLEGGSIDVNGQGLLLTTESCLLNENRNPQLTREEVEANLRNYLGVEKVLWLGDGIVGDDTDGHIDDLTRFVAANTVVTVVEHDPGDDNFQPLQANLRKLKSFTNLAGEPLEIIQLPMPSAVTHRGQRLPASYANFYIANEAVLLPTYRCDADNVAADILAQLFPTRRITGIDCTDLVWGLGACHCLTQQVLAP